MTFSPTFFLSLLCPSLFSLYFCSFILSALALLTYVCTSELQEVYLCSRSHNSFEAERKVKKNKTKH